MKKVFMSLIISFVMVACQDDNEKIESTDNNKLGVIIQNDNSSARSALILLDDGRPINPVYGFENFPSTEIGKKLLLSFNVVSVNNGIYNVDVTTVVSADENSFAFTSEPLTLPDSVATVGFLAGGFTGSFTYCLGADCNTGETTVTLNGENYTSSKGENNFPAGGAGTMSLTELSSHKITFTNNLEFESINPDLILNGTYYIYAFDNYLSLLRLNGDVVISYLLKKD